MNESQDPSGPQFRADRPQEQDAVRTTIVGGRPPGSGKGLGPIPRGIEVLVKKAAVDDQFKQLLLDARDEAAGTIGLNLDPAEVMMLRAAPAAQLEAIIAGTDVPREQRRAFLGTAAAVMLAAMGVAAPGCGPIGGTKGVRPDKPPKREGVTLGIEPDLPEKAEKKKAEPAERPDRVEPSHGDRPPPKDDPDPDPGPVRGIRADVPVTKGIRPDRIPAPTGSRPDPPKPPDPPAGSPPE